MFMEDIVSALRDNYDEFWNGISYADSPFDFFRALDFNSCEELEIE